MKILHLSRSFSYQTTGGTEIFVESLAQAQSLAHDVLWTAHSNNTSIPDNFKGFRNCHALKPVSAKGRLDQVTTYIEDLEDFKELLVSFEPDILHVHSFCDSCGLSHIKIAKSLDISIVVTVHAPGFTCMQGSLMYHRKEICDGVIRDGRCTECRLVNGRLPRPLAALASAYNWPQISPEAPGAIAHVLTARQLTTAFRYTWEELVEQTDAFHVLCDWSQQVLLRNGVPAEKLHLIRTAGPKPLPPKKRQPMEDGVLRCVYWGRCAAVKGIHLILKAVQSLPRRIPIEISFYGPYWNDDYGQRMQKQIDNDSRFKICGNYPKHELLPKLQAYDLALVPSTWLETGPLTILEAFAAGLAVAGSDLGGIRELLKDRDGCFLLPLDWQAWKKLFLDLFDGKIYLNSPPQIFQNFSTLAKNVDYVYNDITSKCKI